MPVPEGVITTSALWEEPTQQVELAEAMAAVEDDERLVEIIEEELPEVEEDDRPEL